MFELLALSFFTALGAFTLLMWIPGRKKMLGYAGIWDAVFSIGLVIASAGTFSGIAMAFMAGLLFHLMLRIARNVVGHETFNFKTLSWEG